MKKRLKFIVLMLAVILLFGIVSGCSKEEKLTKVRLAVTSVFYPQYVAINKGYFEEKGIDIELSNGSEPTR